MSRTRRVGRALPLLLAATVAAACSGGSPTPSDNAAGQPEAAAVGSSGGGGSGSVVSFGSATGFDETPDPVPGLTVHGAATATVPADQAFVVVVPDARGIDTFGEGAVPPKQRRGVVDALAGLGVTADDVTFPVELRYGGSRVRVKVPLDQLAATGPKVVDAVDRVVGRSLSSGASFGLADCEPAIAPLRRQAAQQADAQARTVAEATRTTPGPVVAVRQDAALPDGPVPRTAPTGCPGVVDGGLQGFDDPPTVKLSVGLTVTYAITGAPPAGTPARPGLVAVGSSTAKAKADEAYVLVVFESDDDTLPPGPSRRDRDRVVDAVAKLGIDRKDVEFTTSDYPARIVRVETTATGLEKTGKDVVRAVEDVLGRSDSSGAAFSSSTCKTLLAKARKDAVADARQRAGALAEASGVKLGELQGVAESTGFGADPCDTSAASLASFDAYDSPLQPFDAEPELRVQTTARLNFAVTG